MHQDRFIELISPFGGNVPPKIVANALRTLVPAAEASALMAVEGRGKLSGRRPSWANKVADIRFHGAQPSSDKMILQFSAPTLGGAAPELFKQSDFWQSPPSEDTTALDLLAGCIFDVSSENSESNKYDAHVLAEIKKFSRVITSDITLKWITSDAPSIDEALIGHVDTLSASIPAPLEVRLTGRLDMLRASTKSLAIQLKDGSQVSGVYLNDDISDIRPLLNERVLVSGKLIFRPTGRPLRIDVRQIVTTHQGNSIWDRLPQATGKLLLRSKLRRPQSVSTGLNSIIGQWPGLETDEELNSALEKIS